MPPVHGPAVCIRQWDWSETSQTVSLFTRQHGVVRALAKGARRPGAPFSGGIELLTLGEAGLIIKPSAELALLTDWDLRASHSHLRRSLGASLAAQHCADVVQALVLDHDAHEALFDALLLAIAAMADAAAVAGALAYFQAAALIHAGLWPVLDRTTDTDGEPAGDSVRTPTAARSSNTTQAVRLFDPFRHGLVSSDVPPLHTLPGASAAWRVRAETVRLLLDLEVAVRTRAAGVPRMPQAAAERGGRLLAAYLRHVLGRDLPTLPLTYPGLAFGSAGSSFGGGAGDGAVRGRTP